MKKRELYRICENLAKVNEDWVCNSISDIYEVFSNLKLFSDVIDFLNAIPNTDVHKELFDNLVLNNKISLSNSDLIKRYRDKGILDKVSSSIIQQILELKDETVKTDAKENQKVRQTSKEKR